MLRRALFVLLAFLLTLPVAAAVPFWGARNSSPCLLYTSRCV